MIRILCSSAILLSLITACGQTDGQSKVSNVSDQGEGRVLQALDETCADTWCSGDYNFSFKRVAFDGLANSTLVEFAMFPWGLESEITDSSCVITGFSQESAILGEGGVLNVDFRSQMNACIKALEDSLN